MAASASRDWRLEGLQLFEIEAPVAEVAVVDHVVHELGDGGFDVHIEAVCLLHVRPVHDEDGIIRGKNPRFGIPPPQVGLSGQGGQEKGGVLVEFLLRHPDLGALRLDPLVEPVIDHLRRRLHQLRLVGKDVEKQLDVLPPDDSHEVLLVQLELVGVGGLSVYDRWIGGQVVQDFYEMPEGPFGELMGLDVLPPVEIAAEAHHVLLEILKILPLFRYLLAPQLLAVDAVALDVGGHAGGVFRDLGLGKPRPHDAQVFEAAPLQVDPDAEHCDDAEDRADSDEYVAVVQDGNSGCWVKTGRGSNFPRPHHN